jgi:hypothetical protein
LYAEELEAEVARLKAAVASLEQEKAAALAALEACLV